MVVRQRGDRTQIAVLEDDILVEHYVTKASSTSYAGNVYLGRVQNVLPSMEAAFVDIGKGRNAVLYAGEVNWDVAGLEGRARSIEHALKSGDNILVQVTKDPIGHKGARLTSQISLPGRYLVYVPNGSMTGISRKLPDTERARLKDILRRIVPDDAGVIIRTAAEGASEEELTRDVERLKAQWETIQRKAAQTKSAPTLLYAEPDLELRVVRDVFNEDFTKLIVSGDGAWEMISQYVDHVAPDLLPRLQRWTGEGDAFHDLRIEEQLLKGLDRKVWLPSGGSLVIDRTEAMTVIDVNTGKFVGQGGNLEQTVTRNNLEAAEEIVRQLRLRDIGGIIVIDFIDMVLESNRDLVLRRLTECLGRDRTKHQVAEVTSLGLVQMTRKRVGQGLLEAFSEPCPTCGGRGVLVHTEPVDDSRKKAAEPAPRAGRRGRRAAAAEAGPPTPAMLAARGPQATPEEVDVASEDHRVADEAVDTVEAVEPEAEVTVRAESEPAGIGELPPAVPDPNAGPPNAPEPVPDPDAPIPAGSTPTGAARERAGAAREPAGAGAADATTADARSAGGAAREPAASRVADATTADATTADAATAEAATAEAGSAGGGIAGAEAAVSAPAGALTPEPAAAEAAVTASSGAGGGRRRGRRRAESAAGSPPPADVPAGPLETVGSVTDGERPAPATRPESPDGGTAPDGSEPVAGSNGVVAPGADTAGFPSAPEPVAGSNGTVGADGNGSTPRRRRRAASRPAGPPQPVSGE
jgi:ribonuclease E